MSFIGNIRKLILRIKTLIITSLLTKTLFWETFHNLGICNTLFWILFVWKNIFMHDFYDLIITAHVSVKNTIHRLFCSANNHDHGRQTCINRSWFSKICNEKEICYNKLRQNILQRKLLQVTITVTNIYKNWLQIKETCTKNASVF